MAHHGRRSDRPLLSIVIPTRERADCLSKCLDAATACKDPRIEFVVSDNAFKDSAASIVASKRDGRIRYVNTGKRVPDAANLEYAFASTTGAYLMHCGDADAVLPGGVRALLDLLETARPDLVNWPQAAFVWPDKDAEGGYLQLKRTTVTGGVREEDPRKIFVELCSNCARGPYLYWGCVSRHIVNRVIDKAGRYFYHTDIGSSCFCNFAEARRSLYMGRPAFAFGQSPAASPGIDANNQCVWAQAFDALLTTQRLLGFEEPVINRERWKHEMEWEIGRMPEPMRTEQADIVDSYLTGKGVSRLDRGGKAWKRQKKRPDLNISIPGLRVSHRNIRLATRPGFMQDIAAAAQVADYIIGKPPLHTSRKPAGDVIAWCGAVLRAANVRFRHTVEPGPIHF